MHASLAEAFEWVLAAYQKTFHPPIDYILSLFSIHLPSAGKDTLVLYLAAGGVLFRTLSYEGVSPLSNNFPKTRISKLRRQAAATLAAIMWPYWLRSIFRHPCLLVVSRKGYHGRLPQPRRDLPPAERKQVIATFLNLTGDDAKVICDERQLLASYAIGLLIAVLCLVVLNAAIDGLSEQLTR
jgi:hypothetical protein